MLALIAAHGVANLLEWNLFEGTVSAVLAAYDSGDYATALREWKPFAERGYAKSQYNMGFMYCEG